MILTSKTDATSSQDWLVDGRKKFITMTDVLKVFPWFTMYSILAHLVSPLRFFLQNLQLKVMELMETVLRLLRVS